MVGLNGRELLTSHSTHFLLLHRLTKLLTNRGEVSDLRKFIIRKDGALTSLSPLARINHDFIIRHLLVSVAAQRLL